MLTPRAFPEFNNPQQLLQLIDANKKFFSKADSVLSDQQNSCLCIGKIRDQACLEDQARLDKMLEFHFTAQIKKGQITLCIPEHDLTVKHPNYRQARQIITDLLFMEIKRKFYNSPYSLEEEMLILLMEFELPFNHNSYQWQVNRINKIYPSKETAEYLLGDNWTQINKLVEFISK
jgi:hypothetical protein